MAERKSLSALSMAAPIVVAAVALALPRLGASAYVQILVYYVAYYICLGQAWNLMSGMTGYVSFAHGALAGIGAYAAVMALNGEWPLAWGLLAGPAAALVASLVIGATSLRLRGVSFTFATLFFQVLALQLVRKIPATGGPGGLALQDIFPIWLPQALMIGLACLATLLMAATRQSRFGVRLLAIKGDESAALALGVPSARMKLAVFCVSAAVAGAAGAIHGLFTASLYPDVVFNVDVSLTALAAPLIGGVATASGAVIGAVLFVGVGEVLEIYAPSFHTATIGLVLLLVILFMPAGFGPYLARRLRPRPRASVAAKAAIGESAE
jgi:branched-chain amino acid transport system permease protein